MLLNNFLLCNGLSPSKGLSDSRNNLLASFNTASSCQFFSEIESEAIIVSRVFGGPAARAGLRRRDLILSLANQNISSVEQFNELISELEKGRSYPILILRAGAGYQYMSIRLPK